MHTTVRICSEVKQEANDTRVSHLKWKINAMLYAHLPPFCISLTIDRTTCESKTALREKCFRKLKKNREKSESVWADGRDEKSHFSTFAHAGERWNTIFFLKRIWRGVAFYNMKSYKWQCDGWMGFNLVYTQRYHVCICVCVCVCVCI